MGGREKRCGEEGGWLEVTLWQSRSLWTYWYTKHYFQLFSLDDEYVELSRKWVRSIPLGLTTPFTSS